MPDDDIVKVKQRKGYLWITLPDTINQSNIIQIRLKMKTVITKENRSVVLDLSNIKSAGSIIINLLMDTRQTVVSLQGTLSLVNLTKECFSLFSSIKLDKVLNIYKSEDEIISGD